MIRISATVPGLGLLDRIYKGTIRSQAQLVRHGVNVVIEHIEETQGNLDAAKGKVQISVVDLGGGKYGIEYRINREPAVRINKPIWVDKKYDSGKGIKNVSERPSIDSYVANKLKRSIAEVSQRIRDRSSPRVNQLVIEAMEYYGVKMTRKGQYYSGRGVVIGGTLSTGFLPASKQGLKP